jgi:hypothetical protein
MRRAASIGAVLLVGGALLPMPALADATLRADVTNRNLFESFARRYPLTVLNYARTTPADCPCPSAVHRRVHARLRHPRSPTPPVAAARERPDYYNFLIPSTYDPAYDRVMVDHFRTPVVTGFDQPWRPRPVWPGFLPYRMRVAEGVLQYDGLIGRYVPLARGDAALIAAAAPAPPPPR